MTLKTTGACALVLASIVAANIISSHYGPSASIYNAFFLVGIALTTKDYLYDAWGKARFRNTAALIAAGGLLSYFCAHWFAGSTPAFIVHKIAIASFVAFTVSETMDTIVYALRHRAPWLERSNTSNVVGAFFDSAVFVSVAFGWSWPIIFGQFCAKVAGGFIWSLVIEHARTDTATVELNVKVSEPDFA